MVGAKTNSRRSVRITIESNRWLRYFKAIKFVRYGRTNIPDNSKIKILEYRETVERYRERSIFDVGRGRGRDAVLERAARLCRPVEGRAPTERRSAGASGRRRPPKRKKTVSGARTSPLRRPIFTGNSHQPTDLDREPAY